ncbi:MAG TPA: PAS domain S-box protein, partial [Bryobacteraceae bacterium]|nr:PAS domain S-box protein [Bryobacteraceae bacterium]
MERTDFEQWKAREVARLLALVETERRYYQEMVASLPVALVVLSADRSILSANRAFRQSFGVRAEELRRKSIEQIIPEPRLIERIRDTHVQGARQGDLYAEVEGRPLRIAVMPIRNWDDEGELETLLMVEDLTAIGKAMETMGFATAAATAPAPEPVVVEVAKPVDTNAGMPAVLWRADSSFEFTSVSGDAEPLLGYPASHWLETQKFFEDRIHPEDRAAAMAFYAAALGREGDASAEFRAVTSSGGVKWCRETVRVSAEGAVTGVMTDITLRKQLEEQLLTAERHDALHGLSSRLSHDLNNPLMIITGYSEEMLQELPAESSMREDLEQILGASERISGITGQLLGFTRKLANPPQQVELGMLILSMEDRIAKAAGEEVAVEYSTPGEPVWASADPAQLEEILLAMVSSARDDAQGRSRVTMGWEIDAIPEQLPEATLRPGMYARVTIHDNGRGADAESRISVFESVLAKAEVNSELGRAYAMVREWGGDIAFASDAFRGSTFMLYLPYVPPETPEAEESAEDLAAESAPEAEAAPVVEAPAAAEPEPQYRETILLVEDEAGIRAL